MGICPIVWWHESRNEKVKIMLIWRLQMLRMETISIDPKRQTRELNWKCAKSLKIPSRRCLFYSKYIPCFLSECILFVCCRQLNTFWVSEKNCQFRSFDHNKYMGLNIEFKVHWIESSLQRQPLEFWVFLFERFEFMNRFWIVANSNWPDFLSEP